MRRVFEARYPDGVDAGASVPGAAARLLSAYETITEGTEAS